MVPFNVKEKLQRFWSQHGACCGTKVASDQIGEVSVHASISEDTSSFEVFDAVLDLPKYPQSLRRPPTPCNVGLRSNRAPCTDDESKQVWSHGSGRSVRRRRRRCKRHRSENRARSRSRGVRSSASSDCSHVTTRTPSASPPTSRSISRRRQRKVGPPAIPCDPGNNATSVAKLPEATEPASRIRRNRWDETPMKDDHMAIQATATDSNLRARRGLGRWDVKPMDDQIATQTALAAKLQSMAPQNSRKRREVYLGNLQLGQVNSSIVSLAFQRLFQNVPEFADKYPGITQPVRSVAFPPNGSGMFAFVEFVDEILCSTAVLMNGFELCGRPVKVGRPQGYEAPTFGELPPLDIAPLRSLGLIPGLPKLPTQPTAVTAASLELYFGNLAANFVTETTMIDLLMPVIDQLPEYDPEKGAAITKVNMSSNGYYCFIQFQSEDLATRILEIFEGTDLCGRELKVKRPSTYGATYHVIPPPPAAEVAPTLFVPPPPPPPPSLLAIDTSEAELLEMAAAQGIALTPPPPPPPSLLAIDTSEAELLEMAAAQGIALTQGTPGIAV